jgi:hypothetical protein
MAKRRKVVLLLGAGLLVVAALFFGTAAGARADYGPGAVYQVEISANAAPGPSFWFWAELDPGGASGDYQMTDCIHVGRGGRRGDGDDLGGTAVVGHVRALERGNRDRDLCGCPDHSGRNSIYLQWARSAGAARALGDGTESGRLSSRQPPL